MSNTLDKQKNSTQQNFTFIPNIIFDHWQKKISHSAFCILCCIIRNQPISVSSILQFTRCSRTTIIKSLKRLIEFELISIEESESCRLYTSNILGGENE